MLRVLLVDDDPDVLDALGDWLRRRYVVRTALGFRQAIAALSEGPIPDVVISDLDMPPFSGEDLLTVIAARFPGVCRVLHTGSKRDRLIRRESVAHHELVKGCDLDELEAIIRRCGHPPRCA
jgi:DNA-binding NtrC family response regulator